MNSRCSPGRVATCVLAALLCLPGIAWAGMPRSTAVLEEVPKLRLQSISFFLAGFFLSALLIQLLWNALRKDFLILPRLSYLRAVGLVALWGLLFVLVLTMISGARELMTPGAWEPKGVTYRLAKKAGPESDEPSESARKEHLLRLKDSLWSYASTHGGRFPTSRDDQAFRSDWYLPGESGARYVYAGGEAVVFDGVPLAYEPEVFSGLRWVLFTDGTIRQMTTEEIRRTLAGGKKR